MAYRDYLNRVAHDLIKVAINPDRLRALLDAVEGEHPGTLSILERHLDQQTRNM